MKKSPFLGFALAVLLTFTLAGAVLAQDGDPEEPTDTTTAVVDGTIVAVDPVAGCCQPLMDLGKGPAALGRTAVAELGMEHHLPCGHPSALVLAFGADAVGRQERAGASGRHLGQLPALSQQPGCRRQIRLG